MTALIATGADDVVLEIRYQDGPDLRPRSQPVYDAGFDPDAAWDAMQVARIEAQLAADAEAMAERYFAACRHAVPPDCRAGVLAAFRRLALADLTDPIDDQPRGEGGSDAYPW